MTRFFSVISAVLALALLTTFLTSMGGQEDSGNLEMIERSTEQEMAPQSDASPDEATETLRARPSATGPGSSAGEGTAAIGPALSLQNSFRAVSQAVLPSVVEVNVVNIVEQQVGSPFPFRGRRGGETREFRRSGLGSGVVVARDGETVYVLTNHHVIAEADEISVALYDGRSYDVEVVGSDESQDLALVSFETVEDVPMATLGDSDTLMVGDWVLAVGNPFGFESTVTAGIVSAIGREADLQNGLAGYNEYIQTDAAINRGNSGGALVNIFGEVVGINSWIASPSGGSIGLGFAIPINTAKAAIEDFVQYGGINYGWLGVSIGDVSEDMRDELDLGDATGSFIYNIYRDGPAEDAGLLPGDLITAIDGENVEDSNDLARTVAGLEEGTDIELSIIRLGGPMVISLEIGNRPDEAAAGTAWPGFSAVSLTDEMRRRLGAQAGDGEVVIASVLPESPAGLVGLRSGDILVAVDGADVDSLTELYERLGEAGGRNTELTLVRRGQTITVDLPRS